jgi:hypothetical protein
VVHVQTYIVDGVTGDTQGKSYSLNNREVLDDEGEVVVAAGAADAWVKAYHADPDHAETWVIDCMDADASLSVIKADLTREVEADGNGYLTRTSRA